MIAFAAPAARANTGARAAIDLGTSSVKMLVVDQHGRTLVDKKANSNLGARAGSDRLILRSAQQRTLAALKELARVAAEHGVPAGNIELVATAAVRNADGVPSAYARRAGKKTGASFIADLVAMGFTRARILSGAEEALWGARGAFAGAKVASDDDEKFVVFDLGGGSHQVTVATPKAVLGGGSTSVGSHHVFDRVMRDEEGKALRVLSKQALTRVDARLAKDVPELPIPVAEVRGAKPVLIGGLATFLSSFVGKGIITRGELERADVGAAGAEAPRLHAGPLARSQPGPRDPEHDLRARAGHEAAVAIHAPTSHDDAH